MSINLVVLSIYIFFLCVAASFVQIILEKVKSDFRPSKKIQNWLIIVFLVAAIFFCLVWLRYLYNFSWSLDAVSESDSSSLIDQTRANWGSFGDFIGGVLSPIFAFFTFSGLLYTIHLQKKSVDQSKEALENAKREVELTRQAIDLSTKELEQTKESIKNQTDSLIFQRVSAEKKEKKDDLLATIKYLEQHLDHFLDTRSNVGDELYGANGTYRYVIEKRDKKGVEKCLGPKMTDLIYSLRSLYETIFSLKEVLNGERHPLERYIEIKFGSLVDILEGMGILCGPELAIIKAHRNS